MSGGNCLANVNRLIDDEAAQCVRHSVICGVPLDDGPWKTRVASCLGLNITLRPRARRRKDAQRSS